MSRATLNRLILSMGDGELYPSSRRNYRIEMTKTRTVTFLMMVISTCALILSLTDAHPAAEVTTESNLTDVQGNSNSSVQLAITHVVKTIEFEVGILEDDGGEDENSTDTTTEDGYIETEIKLLNVNLLRELLARASEDDVGSTSKKPNDGNTTPQTKP